MARWTGVMDGAVLALHAGLEAVLRLQDGIIRRDQALAAGVAEATVESRVRRRSWIKVLPRVYAVQVDPQTPIARIRATALWAGDDAVITGHAAAWWWDLTDRAPDVVEVVVPLARRMSKANGVRVIRSDLDDREIDGLRRLRVTTPAATCLRLARTGRPDLLDAAMRQGLRDSDLDRALTAGFHRRGQVQARRSREEVRDHPWSNPERALHCLLRQSGITGWVANPSLWFGDQRRHPDVLVEDAMLIVEVDGRQHHSTPEQHEDDHRRQNVFIDRGYLVLRFTPRQIADEPDEVIALIRRTIERRRPPALRAAE